MFPVVILGTWLCIHISHGFCLDDHTIASAKEEMCQVGTGYCTHVIRWSFKQWWIPPKIAFGHGRWCQISGFLVYLICRQILRIYGDLLKVEGSSRWNGFPDGDNGDILLLHLKTVHFDWVSGHVRSVVSCWIPMVVSGNVGNAMTIKWEMLRQSSKHLPPRSTAPVQNDWIITSLHLCTGPPDIKPSLSTGIRLFFGDGSMISMLLYVFSSKQGI